MKEKILKILQEIRADIDFQAETQLIDKEVLESFDIIQIATTLMDSFAIDIDADDIEPENFNSFNAICNMVEKN